jgi:hypothetical protein
VDVEIALTQHDGRFVREVNFRQVFQESPKPALPLSASLSLIDHRGGSGIRAGNICRATKPG